MRVVYRYGGNPGLRGKTLGHPDLCRGEDFVSTEMEADVGGWFAFKVEGADYIQSVGAEVFPGVGFGDDISTECFGNGTAVGFVRYFKDEFAHRKHFTMEFSGGEEMTKRQEFTAVLEKDSRALGWTVVRVPFDPAEVWAERVRLRVCGEVNGFGFRTSLFPDRRGGYYLLVNRADAGGCGAGAGKCGGVCAEAGSGGSAGGTAG